jgi:hypothetical protein
MATETDVSEKLVYDVPEAGKLLGMGDPPATKLHGMASSPP